MTTLVQPVRLLALQLALMGAVAISAAACGGSASPTASGAAPTTAGGGVGGGGGTEQPIASDEGSGGGGGRGGGGTPGLPRIADGVYQSGTAHYVLSGGQSDKRFLDMGGGTTSGGAALITLSSADNQSVLILTLTPAGDPSRGGLAITTEAYSIGGEWGDQCQITITRNDSSALGGTFTCTNAVGIFAGSTTALSATIEGTFTVSR